RGRLRRGFPGHAHRRTEPPSGAADRPRGAALPGADLSDLDGRPRADRPGTHLAPPRAQHPDRAAGGDPARALPRAPPRDDDAPPRGGGGAGVGAPRPRREEVLKAPAIRAAAALLALAAAFASSPPRPARALPSGGSSRPSVLLVVVDTLRYDGGRPAGKAPAEALPVSLPPRGRPLHPPIP